MYNCEKYQATVPANTKANRIVIETRHKQYPRREHIMKRKIEGKVKHITDPGGYGYETVREIMVCTDCMQRLKKPG